MKAIQGILIAVLLLAISECSHLSMPPPVYGVQSADNPETILIFFSTMAHFQRMDITKALYFLTSGTDEIYDQFLLSETTCLANSSFCYIRGKVPNLRSSSNKQPVCAWQFAVRGNVYRNGEVCRFINCPNMENTVDCPLIVHSKDCPSPCSHSRNCSLPAEIARYQALSTCPETSTYSPVISTVGTPKPEELVGFLVLALCLILFGVTAYAVLHWYCTPPPVVFVTLKQMEDGDLLVAPMDKKKVTMSHLMPPIPSKADAKKIVDKLEYSLAALAKSKMEAV